MNTTFTARVINRRTVIEAMAREGVRPDDDVVRYLTEQPWTNAREIEGVVIRLIAYASLANKPITLQLAEYVLANIWPFNLRFVAPLATEDGGA